MVSRTAISGVDNLSTAAPIQPFEEYARIHPGLRPIVQPASRTLHCLILAVADFPSAGHFSRRSSCIARNSVTHPFKKKLLGSEAGHTFIPVALTIWNVRRTPNHTERTRQKETQRKRQKEKKRLDRAKERQRERERETDRHTRNFDIRLVYSERVGAEYAWSHVDVNPRQPSITARRLVAGRERLPPIPGIQGRYSFSRICVLIPRAKSGRTSSLRAAGDSGCVLNRQVRALIWLCAFAKCIPDVTSHCRCPNSQQGHVLHTSMSPSAKGTSNLPSIVFYSQLFESADEGEVRRVWSSGRNERAEGNGIPPRKPTDQRIIRLVSHSREFRATLRNRNQFAYTDSLSGRVKRFGRFLAARSWEPTKVIEVNVERRQNERAGGNGRFPRKRPAQFPLAVTRPGIEPGSPWWEASGLTAQPPLPLDCSPPTKARRVRFWVVFAPRYLHVGIVPDGVAGRRVFSGPCLGYLCSHLGQLTLAVTGVCLTSFTPHIRWAGLLVCKYGCLPLPRTSPSPRDACHPVTHYHGALPGLLNIDGPRIDLRVLLLTRGTALPLCCRRLIAITSTADETPPGGQCCPVVSWMLTDPSSTLRLQITPVVCKLLLLLAAALSFRDLARLGGVLAPSRAAPTWRCFPRLTPRSAGAIKGDPDTRIKGSIALMREFPNSPLRLEGSVSGSPAAAVVMPSRLRGRGPGDGSRRRRANCAARLRRNVGRCSSLILITPGRGRGRVSLAGGDGGIARLNTARVGPRCLSG
ncbi:hypothetical protein PR048_030119 [Dryococelus australis]|uniref:Uncharacterized protein n=1 Tax=Dryococelus australis TaxID=614101 RepID=A0ABQ9G821_9NEOP|nr:hypothetical protein PR048_030119 [Dryococelus australis]